MTHREFIRIAVELIKDQLDLYLSKERRSELEDAYKTYKQFYDEWYQRR